MADQTAASISTESATREEFQIDVADRAVLRDLATMTAEVAARPIESEKRDLWYRHNALETTRPLVFCDPENGWNEIIKPVDLLCHSQPSRRLRNCTIRVPLGDG